MEFNNEQPIYVQIMDFMKYKIIRGELTVGEQVPSVRDVAMELKVNPNTVQRSYQELRNENILFSKRGLGNFVSEDENLVSNLKKDMAKDIFDTFITEIMRLGLEKHEVVGMLDIFWEEYNDRD